MTVATTENLQQFVGDGISVEFFFTYQVLDVESVFVFIDDIPIIAGFTVFLNPDQDTTPGGTVTFDDAPLVDEIISVLRIIESTQETDYTSYDPFPADSHERALDKLTMLVQQTDNDSINAIRVPLTDPPDINKVVPGVIDRASKFLFFDAFGNATVQEGTVVDLDAVEEIGVTPDSGTMLLVDSTDPKIPLIGVNNIDGAGGLMKLVQQGDYPEFPGLPGGGIPIAVLENTPFLLFAVPVDDGTAQPGTDSQEMLTTYRQTNPTDPFGFVDILAVNTPNQADHLVQLDEFGQIPSELLRQVGLRNRGIFRGDDLCDKPGDEPLACTVPDTRNPSERFPALDYPPGTDPETIDNDQFRAGDFFTITMEPGELSGTMNLFTDIGDTVPSIVTVEANDGITFIPQITDPDPPNDVLTQHGWYHQPGRFNLTTADLVSVNPAGWGFIGPLPNDNVQQAFNDLDTKLGLFAAADVIFDTSGGTVIIQPGSEDVQLALLDLDVGTVNLLNAQTIGGQKTFSIQLLTTAAQSADVGGYTRRDFVEAADAVILIVADQGVADAAAALAVANSAQSDATQALADAAAAQGTANQGVSDAAAANANASSRKLETDFLRTGDRLDLFNVRIS